MLGRKEYMLENTFGFYETESCFNDVHADYLKNAGTENKKLLVKAHEKEIYEYGDHLVIAKIHRDNNCTYPFSKMDFLSHKIQELLYPENIPKIYAADFTDSDKPVFVIERIKLDKFHTAFNIVRQRHHQNEGLDYQYDRDFLSVDPSEDIEILASRHMQMVDEMKKSYENLLPEKGIAFDYSYVNIAWRNQQPVALEVHKSQRGYLFCPEICYHYFDKVHQNQDEKEIAMKILKRIEQLRTLPNHRRPQ